MRLPSEDEVVEIACARGVQVRRAAVRRALLLTEHCSVDALDVPAAVHFAFTRPPPAFSQDREAVLAALLTWVERELGVKILATPAELHAQLSSTPSLEETRAWFAGRVMPYGG